MFVIDIIKYVLLWIGGIRMDIGQDKVIDYNWTNKEIIKYLREQRHDFMNHIQVIWGYLQLNKPSEAMKYIGEFNKKYSTLGSLFKLESPALSLFLYDNIKKAFKLDLHIDLETELDNMEDIFDSKYREDLKIISILFDEVMIKAAESGERTMYIDIFQEDNMFYMVFSNVSFDDFDDCSDGCWTNRGNDVREALEQLQKRGVYTFYMMEGSSVIVKTGFSM